MCSKFIKSILPLPSFFEIALPSEEEPHIFRATAAPQTIACLICAGATVSHDQGAIEAVLKKVNGKIQTVISDFAPAMAGAIQAIYPTAIHVLNRFHLVQFFTDAQQRRRRYLVEAKKHHKSRYIDRCLARKPEAESLKVYEWRRRDSTKFY